MIDAAHEAARLVEAGTINDRRDFWKGMIPAILD
jgi:hypothetical protein